MRCLVIEDEINTSRYICNGLQSAGYTTVPCYDAINGKALALSSDWDVVILDRLLPGGVDGLDILAGLRDQAKPTPVLVVSALSSIDERVRGLRQGADDYLIKPFALDELLARVDVLTRRKNQPTELRVLQFHDLYVDLRTNKVTRSGQVLVLQPREFRLLEYLMRHEGQVVTRSMLLEAVWEYHFDPQTNVIDVQISRLRNKIDKGFAIALIHTVRGIGYRFAAEGADSDV